MKKIIVIGLLIAVIMIIVTATLIINDKTNSIKYYNVEPEVEDISLSTKQHVELYKELHLPIKDGVKGAEFGDTYSTNALNWEKVYYEDNTIAGYYYQISGLKNKDIQSKVNKKLKQTAIDFGKEAYEAILNDKKENGYYGSDYYVYSNNEVFDLDVFDEEYGLKPTSWKAYFDQCIVGSFSNVISVATGSYGNETWTNKYYWNRKADKYVNVDLNTGEDLSIECLFTGDSDIISILRNLLYMELADYDSLEYIEDPEHPLSEDEDNYWMWGKEEYKEIFEDKLEKLIAKFKYSNDYTFYFSPEEFGFRIDDYLVEKKYIELEGNIAIYNRYSKDKNLYEDENIAYNGLSVFTDSTNLILLENDIDNNGVIYSLRIISSIDEGIDNKSIIIDKGIEKIKEIVAKEVENVRFIKKNEDDIIILNFEFEIFEPHVVSFNKADYNDGDGIYSNIYNKIDYSKKFFGVDYNYYEIFKTSKEKYNSGIINELFKLRMLKNINWGKYYESYYDLFNSLNATKEYRSDLYTYMINNYIGFYYSLDDFKPIYGNEDALKYILKDNSADGVTSFVEAVLEFVRAREKSNNYSVSAYALRDMSTSQYGIAQYGIRFYFHNDKYDYDEFRTFYFIERTYYEDKSPYPLIFQVGVT